MEPFRYHVYACEQRKPDGAPCCSARGSLTVIDALRREVAAQGLADVVQITTSGSLGLCESGPNLVVYPEGVWYSGVQEADVAVIVREHFGAGQPVARLVRHDAAALKTEITENRDRYLAAMKARAAAGVVPDDISLTARGFMESRILLTAVELDLFTLVGAGATAAAVARAAATTPRATETMLNALVAMGLLTKTAGEFACAPLARRFLAAGSPDDARAALRHNLSLWETWSTLTECVRQGTTQRTTEMVERGDDWTIPFIALMHRNAAQRAPQVVRAVGVEGVRRMLDVGGGSGAYCIAFAQASPTLQAEIFDLETVLPIARGHVEAAGLASRVTVRVGDLRTDELGGGYDLVLLSAICHMLSPAENADLFARIQRALAPGGRVVIQDHVMAGDGTAPRPGAIFAVNMLVGTPGGGTYTADEYATWLRGAGFPDVRHVPMPGPNDLVIGTRA